MSYKLLILAPSAGGKSTLMRNLRDHTSLDIAESDEEVMKANNNVWPDDRLKNEILIPQTTKEILARDSVIYFASYIPEELIAVARDVGFRIILLDLPIETLRIRNRKRMNEEGYDDANQWHKMQLENYESLRKNGYVDQVISGNQPIAVLAKDIQKIANTKS